MVHRGRPCGICSFEVSVDGFRECDGEWNGVGHPDGEGAWPTGGSNRHGGRVEGHTTGAVRARHEGGRTRAPRDRPRRNLLYNKSSSQCLLPFKYPQLQIKILYTGLNLAYHPLCITASKN